MSEDEKKKILLEKVREFEVRTGHTTDSWPDDPDNTASVLKEHRYLSEPLDEKEARRQMFIKSRRGFLVGGAAALIGFFGWRQISDETKAGMYKRAFEFNERVSQIFYRPTRLAPEFTPEQITEARVNSDIGMTEELDAGAWRLSVGGLAGRSNDLLLSMDDIKRLPRTEMITQFKCIEGWNYIAKWAGVRFSDFAAAYPPANRQGGAGDVINSPQDLRPYVSLTTADENYYVGWDIQAMLHPQTLLAYELNGAPLTPEHGAPLRIASPNKYGIKQIKRIGRIEFTDTRPRDFWALPENGGYDWYSGH